MKKQLLRLTSSAAAFALAASCVPASAQDGASHAYINTFEEHQTMDGVGGAFAWYKEWLVDSKYSDELYKLLFEEAGLDVIRFRNTYDYLNDNGEGAFSPEYDKAILENAEKYAGHDIPVLMSSWSPAAYMKDNDAVSGGTTIKKKDGQFDYEGYGEYFYNMVKAYADAGVDIDYLSIQNEPDFKAEYDSCQLSGTETDAVAGYDKAYEAVYNRLQALGDAPQMAGPDTMTAGFSALKGYIEPVESRCPGSLAVIAHHLYTGGSEDNPDSYVKGMNKLRDAYPDIKKWQTEYYRGDAIGTGWIIHNSFTEEDDSAYIYWDTAWGNGAESPVELWYPGSDDPQKPAKEYKIGDKLYSLMHYAKYMDPGYARVGTTSDDKNLRVSAYMSPEKDKLEVVIVNTAHEAGELELDFNGYETSKTEVFVSEFEEGKTDRFAPKGELKDGRLTVPAYSMVTIAARGAQGDKPSEIKTADESWRNENKPPRAQSVYGAPDNIDAKPEAVWESAEFFEAQRAAHGDHGASAKFKTLWDEKYLYVYAEVTDTTPDVLASDAYQRDSVEFFMNENGDKPDAYTEGDAQYRVDLNNEQTFSGNCDEKNFKTAVAKTDTGYIVEAAIPFTLGAPSAGKEIGFDFQVNDAHGKGEREYILKWSDASDFTWSSLQDIGTLELVKTASSPEPSDDGRIHIFLDGEELKTDAEPEIRNDTALVPFRALLEALGAEVEWDDSDKRASASKDGMKIEMRIGDTSALVNGEEYTLSAAPLIVNGRTLVPLRFVSEKLGCGVEWKDRTITIISKE